jgi:hypothetical protein
MPQLGDKQWEVEYCESCPLDKQGDAILDSAYYVVEEFPTRAKALARAKQLLPLDFFGCVRITPYTYDWIGDCLAWIGGESEFYSGD